jgi:hypothetical protein
LYHDSKDWKGELFKFLLNYRVTCHATTGKCPAELLFNRTITTKLPQFTAEITSRGERETRFKLKMKDDANHKTKAKSYEDIVVRDSMNNPFQR